VGRAHVSVNLANAVVLAVLPQKKVTILCCFADPQKHFGRKTLLQEQGYRILEASNERDALALFLSNRVNAVILDFELHESNADVLAAQMKNGKPKVPIMLLSALGLPDSKLRAVDAYLSLSDPPDIFLSLLENLLRGRTPLFFSHWIEDWKSRIFRTVEVGSDVSLPHRHN